jgi:hexokinase
MSDSSRLHQFLLKHRLLSSQYDSKEIVTAFLGEMEKGLNGNESSLAMIPSYIHVPGKAPKNEKIIVLDAGGTNFRTALVMFDLESKPNITYFTNNPMPGVATKMNKEDFFDQIADYVRPILKESDRLGFCFSYPTLIDRQRDGKLLYWTKEVKAPEVVGEKILANLSQTLRRRGLASPEKMLILNDTVASLLAGVTATYFSVEYDYMGFILGTGTNTCYIESNKNILKEKGLDTEGNQAINIESANFNKFNRGDIDLAFDAATANPGKCVIEKMISGAYLGNLCHKILLTAASEGLFSHTAQQTFLKMAPINTPDLNAILSDPIDRPSVFEGFPEDDLIAIKGIISEAVERAALFTAINLAAAMLKSSGKLQKKKYCISADGSVYYKLYSFKQRADKYLSEIVKPYDIEFKIVHVKDAPIIGTAVAGLAG